ncbi:cysteine desulfurase [Candidatus Saccharibacteria bacterium]|nr:cysteine desulfurase [Candidatus Saccharibacteria bacterium]
MKQIYLDYAAATPLSEDILAAMKPYFSERFYNPSATYLVARNVRGEMNDIRHRAAVVLGAKPAEIVFTAGATEANNLAIQGVLNRYPKSELLVSAVEHESVMEPAKLFGAKEIPVDANGTIILNKLSNLINEKTVLVSMMYVNNELGTIHNLKEIAGLLAGVRTKRREEGNTAPIYLHTDAAQAGNYLDLHVSRLGVDLMSINGGKLYGPKQSGLLFVKAGVQLQPMIVGGGQESGFRSGTENVAADAGLVAALEQAQAGRAAEAKRVTALRQDFEREMAEKLPTAIINGSKSGRAPHIVSLTLPGKDNERLMMELDERGIMCAVGSACSASRDEASHTLSAIGLNEADARATLRFSLGRETTAEELRHTLKVLAELTL